MRNRFLGFIAWSLSGLSFVIALAGLSAPGASKLISLAFFGWSLIFMPPLWKKTIEYGLTVNIISRVLALVLLPLTFSLISVATDYQSPKKTVVETKSDSIISTKPSEVNTSSTTKPSFTSSTIPIVPPKDATKSPSQIASPLPMRTDYSVATPIEDSSTAGAKRFALRIFIPLGRTREEVTATLDLAVRELATKTNADAAIVWAYRPEDNPSDEMGAGYTVGMATYAPFGDWSRAREGGEKRVVIDLAKLYFSAPIDKPKPSDVITLSREKEDEIEVHNSAEEWGENIEGKVANGTKAKVLEIRTFPGPIDSVDRL